MPLTGPETCALPEAPALAGIAKALNEARQWAEVVDADWRWLYSTDDMRLSLGGLVERAPIPVGAHYFGPEAIDARLRWRGGANTRELMRDVFAVLGGMILADTRGGRDELRTLVDPAVRDLVDGLVADDERVARTVSGVTSYLGGPQDVHRTVVRIRDETGRLAGTAMIFKPLAGMSTLAAMSVGGDLGHFERMLQVAKPGRRPAAMLFADLEASSPLARRLSTASYFALGRRLVRAADQCVVDNGGLVGRHLGDGVVAFFLAETAGSESAAARSCITAARALRAAMTEVAAECGLEAEDVTLRFGLHWSSTLYVGQITTRGRSEVNGLGDQVSEAARIEACAAGGRALASKDLVERLEPGDAAALDLDPGRVTYTQLADLPTATEKARRDAPAIAVCEI